MLPWEPIFLMRMQKLPIYTFSIISQWKLYVAIATRVLIRMEEKHNYLLPSPCYMYSLERISLTGSEEKSLENVDGRRALPDACIYYKLTYETAAQVC